jgi:hypothetical protein
VPFQKEELNMKPPKALSLIGGMIILLALLSNAKGQISFTGPELLARPTDHSITLNVVANTVLQAYAEYGTTSGAYPNSTSSVTAAANDPIVIVIDGLAADTKYYYRLRYRVSGSVGSYFVRTEHTFHTQRSPSSTFSFAITSDSHVNILLGVAATWEQTLSNVANDSPDFLVDCGDTFAMDYGSGGDVTTAQGALDAYFFQRSSSFFGSIAHSVPIFLAIGNHEDEEGWHLDDYGNPVNSTPVWSTNARKRYFPNPIPDGFYSGNTDTYSAINGDHLHEDYYSWAWGNALFVVIDPFWYTTTKPFTAGGPGEGFDAGSGDRWDWTLGDTQYNWLKQILENSTATFKFLFMHHMTGGTQDYIRGGAYAAPYCEWGGYNEQPDQNTWAFDTRRPEWSAPVHQLLVANGVSAVFHGHDHQYAYEMRDGVVYQSLPAAGFSGNGFNVYNQNNALTIRVLPSPGHLRVTVSPTRATVDYVNSTTANGANRSVAYSYTIDATPLPIQLASFTASLVRQNDVEVTWMTVSETNNYGFEVYRKRNGTGDWEKLTFVEGHGTTLSPHSYSYLDHAVSFGSYAYFIKQIDLDGETQPFPETSVMVGLAPGEYVLTQNYPNPFNPSTLIEFAVPQTGFASLKVYNILGQQVATLFEGTAEAGRIYTSRLDASRLASGVYAYRLAAGSFVGTKRMLLLR